jgi:cytochrome c-type biogenesis protein
MDTLIIAFLAGALTILAPCVLPLLPIIIGGSISGKSINRAIIITCSLAISVSIFTLLLRASTLLIDVPQSFWTFFSGGIVFGFGAIMLFPKTWTKLSTKSASRSHKLLHKASKKENVWGSILIGASLGPVFTSCSPTYALILALILPISFFNGVLHIIIYSIGLSSMMFLIAIFGRKIISKLGWASNSNSLFKKTLGILFIAVGLAIMTGYDKEIESLILDTGYTGLTSIEENLVEKLK